MCRPSYHCGVRTGNVDVRRNTMPLQERRQVTGLPVRLGSLCQTTFSPYPHEGFREGFAARKAASGGSKCPMGLAEKGSSTCHIGRVGRIGVHPERVNVTVDADGTGLAGDNFTV
jgi:hypothetical protein